MKTRSTLLAFTACYLQWFYFAAADDNKAIELQNGPPVDAQGEWYEVGFLMAKEAMPSFRMFGISDADLSLRMNRVIETLGVDSSSIKVADMKVLQQGWDDAVADKKQAMTFPPDQRGSLVPQALRGFHRFTDSASTRIADRAAEWKKAVVIVRVQTKNSSMRGTGFFIGPGLLLTNHHVVEDAIDRDYAKLEVQLAADQSVHEATIVATEEKGDVALLRIKLQNHATIPIGDSDVCRELDEVVLIGYPAYDRPDATLVTGEISSTAPAPDEPDLKKLKDWDLLLLNIEATGGNSGGPIVSVETGQVVGILTGGIKDKRGEKLRQMTYAPKSNFILPFLEKYAKGKFERGP